MGNDYTLNYVIKDMEKIRYKLTSPVLMWTIIIIGGIILWQTMPHVRLFYSGMLGSIIFALGVTNWLYVMYKASSVHHQAPASVNSINALVTEGMYAVVRHPIYAADIVLFWCIFLLYPAYSTLAIVAWATVMFIFWAGLEERMLEEKFMEDYRQYKQNVPMLIPRFKK